MDSLLAPDPETSLFEHAAQREGVGSARSHLLREVLGLAPGSSRGEGAHPSNRDRSGPRSTLNNDGTALQVCTSVGERGDHLRLIVDPAAEADSPAERFDLALEAVHRTANASRDPGLALAVLERLDGVLPPREVAARCLGGRALWHATDFERRGLGIYATARFDAPSARWPRTRTWLEELGGGSTARAWNGFANGSRVASLGLEGSSPLNLRAKVYLRPNRAMELRELPDPRFRDPAMLAFLHHALGDLDVPPSALLLSFSVFVDGPRQGHPADIKLDLCAHCARRSSHDWRARIEALGSSLGIDTSRSILSPEVAELAFLGLGIDAEGRPRLNCYWKPLT